MKIVASWFVVLCAACGATQSAPPGTRVRDASANAFSFDERVGWIAGPCLAIADPKLANGTPITVVLTGAPQRIVLARIQEPTSSPTMCSALGNDRAAENAKRGIAFYALEPGAIAANDLGIAIVSPPASPQLVDGGAHIDLDGDGRGEVFSSCMTSEGIRFAVWTERAYAGPPRWSAYYYLAYDTTPSCPNER